MRKKVSVNIFEFHDYRDFLSHVLKDLKKNEKVSMRKISSNIGTTAANLSMVVNGKRKLTFELADKFTSFLKMNKQEENYLKNLIILNDSSDILAKYDAYRKMKRNYAYKEEHANSLESFKYLSNWYNVVIRELVETKGFCWDAKHIQNRLPKKIPLKSVKVAMDFLVKNNFVSIENGVAKIDKNLDCIGGVYKLSLSKFHDEMMKITVDSIYEVESENRCILGHTIALSEKEYHQATELLNEALGKIKKLGRDGQDKDEVYHFTLSTVPVSR